MTLLKGKEADIVHLLQNNMDLFAWVPANIAQNRPIHGLSPTIHKAWSKSHFTKKMQVRGRKYVRKLLEARYIQEIKYPTWLDNIVMVKKNSGKWWICMDFKDLNKAYPNIFIHYPTLSCSSMTRWGSRH